MNIYKRIISFFVVFSICVFSAVPFASASTSLVPTEGFKVSDFTTATSYGAATDANFDFLSNSGGYLATLYDAMTSGVCEGCSMSLDGKHNFLPGEVLTTSWAAALAGSDACVCRYCGISYDEFFNSAYDSYVTDLQTDLGTTTLIDGGIRIYVPITSIGSSNAYVTVNSYTSGTGWSVSFNNSASDRGPNLYWNKMNAPFAGTYSAGYSFSTNDPQYCTLEPAGSGSTWAENVSVTAGSSIGPSTFTVGDYCAKVNGMFSGVNYFMSGTIWLDFYPATGSIPTTQNITINSRPTTIIGDYGIIGDNGTITKVDGNVIVDESSSTVYNPVTNTTLNYTDYAYDYSDRSYNLTLEDGSTMKVTYGDENITINEGDTVYNVYYMVPEPEGDDSGGSGSGSGGDTHSHDYTSEITKQPNCLLSGVRTFTCSCGDSYTKAVPATGHDWLISQQVPNTYDPETGEQLTTGYTIYSCATCGEQYKSTDGNAPPNGSSGDSDEDGGLISGLLGAVGDVIGGLIEGILLLATKALEALTGLGDLFAQMIETVLGFFGGFIDFLSAMFPFLPEETITILNLGLILMIAAAVFNRFFK